MRPWLLLSFQNVINVGCGWLFFFCLIRSKSPNDPIPYLVAGGSRRGSHGRFCSIGWNSANVRLLRIFTILIGIIPVSSTCSAAPCMHLGQQETSFNTCGDLHCNSSQDSTRNVILARMWRNADTLRSVEGLPTVSILSQATCITFSSSCIESGRHALRFFGLVVVNVQYSVARGTCPSERRVGTS